MSVELEQQLGRIGEKARLMAERYRHVLDRHRAALDTIAELRETLAKQEKEIEQLRAKVEYLSVATTIVPDRKMLDDTRELIADLVRDIDRCIIELTD